MAHEIAGVRKHVLASANFLLGVSNFMVLALPESYTVGQTINPAEVDATHPARGIAWVLEGRCSHYLRDSSGPSLELLVKAGRGSHAPRWAQGDDLTNTVVAEHEGQVRLDKLTVGFPRRRVLDRMRAWWPCDRTKRTIQVEILGPEGLDVAALSGALPHTECH